MMSLEFEPPRLVGGDHGPSAADSMRKPMTNRYEPTHPETDTAAREETDYSGGHRRLVLRGVVAIAAVVLALAGLQMAAVLTPSATDGSAAAEPGDLEWNKSTGGYQAGPQGPTVVDGTVYKTSGRGGVSAYDADTGSLKWNQSLPGRSAGFRVVGGTVYVVSDNLTAFDADTGSVRWTREVPEDIDESRAPVVAYGLVFVPADHSIYAFNPESGAPWGVTKSPIVK